MFSARVIDCLACGAHFPQVEEGCLDLLPAVGVENQASGWSERQREMETWYWDLLNSPWAADSLAQDYAPYASRLANLSGMILDIGGGVGLVRDYLGAETTYINLEPSRSWLRAEWCGLADRFPGLRANPFPVRGVGEYLPFASSQFDAVLAFGA